MKLTLENIILVGSVLLILSIVAGKTSNRFGIPVLVIFVIVGMLAGSEGFGGIVFNSPGVARFVGIIALNFILFSGGLETRWEVIKPIIRQGVVLSTLGILITALSVGLFVWIVAGFTFAEGLLLGAIVSSTDAAAVFSTLRSRNTGLKKDIRAILELESGSNDPMAYLLMITVLGWITSQEHSVTGAVFLFLRQVVLGATIGLITGRLGKELINRIALDFYGLYPVIMIALMFFTFGFADLIDGNSFLAIYICAVYLGNQHLIHKKSIIQAYDGLAWLMQIVLFLTLGLLVSPSHIVPVIGIGLLVSGFLMFIARPLSVFASLALFRVRRRTMAFISWVGFRGAVPIVFATYPLLAGIDKSQMIFNLVFFISLSSVLLQGTTLRLAAKWFHVGVPARAKMRTPLDYELYDTVKSQMREIAIGDKSPVAGRKVLELDLPESALIALIRRNGKYITPNGSTTINANDILIVVADNSESLNRAYHSLGQVSPDEI